MWTGGELRHCLVRAVIAAGLAIVVALADPLGLDEAADRHSADVVSRITALFYGAPSYDGRRQVAVVEVSDHMLNESGLGWPPPRSFYGWLLHKLTDPMEGHPEVGRPAAIFLDYAFISRAADEDEAAFLAAVRAVTRHEAWRGHADCQRSPLSKLRCIAWAGGTPVIVGKGYPPNGCLTRTRRLERPTDVALAHAVVVAPLGWPELPDRFHPVLTRADYLDALAEAGSASGPDCDELTGHDAADAGDIGGLRWAPLGFKTDDPAFGYDLAPATAMGYALCLRGRARADLCDLLKAARERHDTPGFPRRDPAGPEWGSVNDPVNQEVRQRLYGDQTLPTDAACAAEKPGLRRALQVGWRQFTSGLGQGVAAVAVPCPYHLTLDAFAFVRTSDEDMVFLRGELRDRAVAIGAAQALTNDWIATPLNARQAGVHYHAMALDNLLESGPSLRRRPPPVFDGDSLLGGLQLDWGEVLEFACLFLIALLVEGVALRVARPARQRPPRWRRRPTIGEQVSKLRTDAGDYWRSSRGQRRRMALVAVALAAVAIVLALTVWLTFCLRWEPVNVVALMGFTLVFAAWELWTRDGWGAALGVVAALTILALTQLTRWVTPPRRKRRQRAPTTPSQPEKDVS